MRYASICSGVEAASIAWEPLGWTPTFFAELAPFPSAVLECRFPSVPNLGDFTEIGEDHGPVDLLVGGTPCQSFSVAGRRAGLDDPRGVLAFEFVRLAARLRARWVVFENVPGLLSDDRGRSFGAFLAALGDAGYGFAYRVLDADLFGVPQHRRRVFVVGCAGGAWQRAAAVLVERACLSGDLAPCPRKRAHVAGCIRASLGRGGPDDNQSQQGHLVAHALRASYDASEDGTGRGTPLVARPLLARNQRSDLETETFVAFDPNQVTSPENRSNPRPGDPCHTLPAKADDPVVVDARQDLVSSEGISLPLGHKDTGHAVAFQEAQTGVREYAIAGSLRANGPGHDPVGTRIRQGFGVRRLTPRECERLQGLPDDWTLVPYRGKPAKDGPRYRAIGNSMPVPVMRWIGERIAAVDALEVSR